ALLHDDQVSSTIGHAPAALDVDPFDEDQIEKAIAEINQAIEKSSQLLK
ncbi:MAG: Serine/threonine protein phosphatase, partial [Massilia sp.]|nr:Serine/threonine protein phosphatase [Massilia sp.]